MPEQESPELERSWQSVAAGSPLRPYQRHAVERLSEALADPGARACLVAPPGAGKTRCALHIAAELALPVEILAPTTTLVEQWQRRIEHNLVSVVSGVAPPVTVRTYAGLRPFQPGALIILDEAHHCGAAWGRSIRAALDGAHRVLGLTATPPHGSPGWNTFVSLVGETPVEIESPPLVRERHLSPYLDLVWPMIADPEETPGLAEAEAALRAAERIHEDALQTWISERLREDLFELTEARFARDEGLLIALCRVRHAQGLSLPLDLPRDEELRESPTLHDRALVLWAWGRDNPNIVTAIDAAGFRSAGRGLVRRRDIAWESLATSHSRICGLKEVLTLEAALRPDRLRALVVTDRDVEGRRLSARQVLKALVADKHTDVLDPILVTGSVFWIDDDLWPRVKDRLPALPWQARADHHEVDVSSWPTARRVALATQLLEEGISRCLVGTRHLLGEGWDCPAVNCVIDLTGITAPVTVNQVRGRALRSHSEDPTKVASLWDIVTLAPGVAGGGRMLEKLAERHAHTLGLDARGRIRAGLSRIDRDLSPSVSRVAENAPAIRARMADRLHELADLHARWAVGQDYSDRQMWRLATPVDDIPRTPAEGLDAASFLKAPLAAGPASLHLTRQKGAVLAWGQAIGGWTAAALVADALAITPWGAALAGALGLMSVIPPIRHHLKTRRGDALQHAALNGLAAALHESDQAQGQLVQDDGEAWLDSEDSQASRLFAESAAELLGPIRYPRYLLLEPGGRVWPVPMALGADRRLARIFAECWAGHVGPAEVLYARQGRGRELLVEAWRTAERPQEVEVVELWE